MDAPLNAKQHSFVLNYIKNGCNAYKAAIDAGYSVTYATVKSHAFIESPNIKQRIINAYRKADNKINLAMAWKVKKLKRVVDEFIPDIGELNPKHVQVAIQAMAELNKMSGDYAPDKRLSVTVDATKDKLIEARKQYEEY